MLNGMILNKSNEQTFLGNVLTLFSGKAAASVISFILIPFIARFFTAEDFGVAAYFISSIAISVPVATLCYERAIILPKETQGAEQLFQLSLLILVIASLAAFVFIATLSVFQIEIAALDKLGIWIWFLPAGLLAVGIINIVENWLVRVKGFSIIAKADVTNSLGLTLSRLLLGFFFSSSVWALIVGYFVGLSLKVYMLLTSVLSPKINMLKLQKHGLIKAAKEYEDFPKFSAPTRFVRAFSKNMPIILLGAFFSPATVGLYAMANRVVNMPVDIAVTAFRRAYLQKSAECLNHGQALFGNMLKYSLIMFVVGLVPFGLLWLKGGLLIGYYLGGSWADAGQYVEALTPYLFTVWVATPTTALVVVLRKQKLWFWIQLYITLAVLVMFLYSANSGLSPIETVQNFVSSYVVANIISIMIIGIVVFNNDRHMVSK